MVIVGMMNSLSAAVPDLCEELTGTWAGRYHDPTGLFNPGNFPLRLNLQYQAGKVYGYTLRAQDASAANFGAQAGAYMLIATCKQNRLSALYFVKNGTAICGDPSTQELQLTDSSTLSALILPYENAMINADLNANLTKARPGSKMNAKLLQQAQRISNASINTCH